MLKTLKNFISEPKYQKNLKLLKQTMYAKYAAKLWNSKGIRKQKSHKEIIPLLTLSPDKTALLIPLNQAFIYIIQYLNLRITTLSSNNYL